MPFIGAPEVLARDALPTLVPAWQDLCARSVEDNVYYSPRYAQALLQSRGYALPTAAIRVRLIHLPNADRRSELMIIYAESAAAEEVPAGAEGGVALDEPALARRVLDAALGGMQIR